MKFLSVLCLNFLLLSYPSLADSIPNKSEIIQQSNECLKDSQKKVCKNLILHMERVQLVEFEKNRFKCQSSILGLQTELIEAYFFNKSPKSPSGIMIPYVIKNC